MINIFQAQKLSLKKIRFSKGKSLFVIIPIALMFAIIVVAASEANNLITVAHNSIFSPIQSQNEVLELTKSTAASMRDLFSDTATTGYTATDNALIHTITNVDNVDLVSALPISPISTTDLFTGDKVDISSLAGLDSEFAKLYTNESFVYTDNQPIPIILNANDFNVSYEDWQGKTEIDINYSMTADSTQIDTLSAQTPIKTKALSYNRDDLIGKTFTVNFGGLDTISDIQQVTTDNGYKFVQKTATEIQTESTTRQTAIAKYWNYDQISKPLSYTFVVAGISEGTDKTETYIPTAFAIKLLQDYLDSEITARNTTAIPTADQNATYTGLVYDGVALQTDTTSTIFAGIRNQVNNQVTSQIGTVNQQIANQNNEITNINSQNRAAMEKIRQQFEASDTRPSGVPGGGETRVFSGSLPNFRSVTSTISQLNASDIKVTYSGMAASYAIPGLVYNKDRTTGEVAGEYTTLDLTNSVPLASNTALIKINAVANRDQVVTDLNSKGYQYQDFSQYKQYDQLESYLYMILNVGSIIFMVVTALFILINMAKFVSEGRKEIGIFRAIGASKGDIRMIFILQTLSYIVIAILAGIVVGVVTVAGLSNVMVNSAQTFINSAVGSTVVLNGNIMAANFLNFNYSMILLYAGGLLLVTLLVSLIPSSQAARVSPVEAIRNS